MALLVVRFMALPVVRFMALSIVRFVLVVRVIPISLSFIIIRSHDLEGLVARRNEANIRLRIADSVRENDRQIAV